MKNTRAFLSFLRGSTLLHAGIATASIVVCMAPSDLIAGTIVWGGATGADIGVAGSWVGGVLPSPAVPDTAQWNGSVAGPLSLAYSNAALAGVSPNAGINLDITSGQTDSLNIDSGTNTGSVRINAITIAAGAGAFSLGNGANSFSLTMGGAGGQTHTWTNNSSAGATIASDVVLNRGGAALHTLALTGTGNWTLNNAITGVDAANNWLVSKSGTGTATLAGTNTYTGATTVTAGALTLANTGSLGATAISINPASNTTATMNSSGTVALTGALTTAIGSVAGGTGILNITSGTFGGGTNPISAGTAGFGVVNVSGGTVSPGQFLVAGITTSGATGIWNISNGVVQITGNNGGTVGATANTTGVVNITGNGSYTSTGTTANGFPGIFVGEAGKGTLNVSGSGSMTLGGVSTSTGLEIGRNNVATSSGVVNLGAVGSGGGTITTNVVRHSGAAATGIFNFHGGTLIAAAGIANTGTGTTSNTAFMAGLTSANVYGEGGTINNSGQNITISQNLLAPTNSGVTAISTAAAGLVTTGYTTAPLVTISGGTGGGATAVATIDNSGVLTGITVTNPGVYSVAPTTVTLSGGGYSATSASSAAITTAANVSGGMTFAGGGVTTLSGTNTYTGTTSVSGGKVSVTGSLAAGSAVSVASGATLAGTGTVSGTTTVASGGNIEGGVASAGKLNLAGLTFSGAANVNIGTLSNYSATSAIGAGAITLSGGAGAAVINIASLGTATPGTYKLLDYTSLGGAGFGGFSLGTLPARGTGILVNTGTGINLQLNGLDFLKWTGINSTDWNTATANWKLNSNNASATYINSPGDSVVFDDSANSNTTVDINTIDVTPTSVIFNNTNQNYLIQGTKGITGVTSLVKNNAGDVVISSVNSYSGATTLNAGTLYLDSASAIGTGTFNINGGAIDSNNGVTLTANNAQNWNADFTFGGTSSLNLGTGAVAMSANRIVTTNGSSSLTVGGLISGTGFSLTKNGTGTLILGAVTPPNSYSGGTTLNSGTLQLNQTTGANAGTLNLAGGDLVLNPPANNFGYTAAINLTADGNISKIGAFQINYTGVLTGNSHALNVSTNASRLYLNSAASGITQINVTGGAVGFDLNVGNRGGGAPVVVSSGAALWFANATNVLANSITLNGGTGQGGATSGALFQEGNNTPTISSAISLASGDSTIGSNSNNGLTSVVTINGPISNTGSLTKSGTNKLLLSGANTYTGSTTVSAGTLAAGVVSIPGVSGAFGNNSAVIMGDVAGAILDITGFNTQIGSITGGGATGGNVTLGAATLTTGADNSSPGAYGGVISGGGSLVKTGTGTQILTGASSFTGDLSINNGMLVANRGNNTLNPVTSAIGNNQVIRNITLSGGSTFQFASGDTLGGNASTILSKFVIGAGSTITNGGGVFNRIGSVTLTGGTLTSVSGAAAGYQTYSLDANAVITASGSAASTISTNGTFPGIHLNANNTFDVADVTGDSAVDLTVSAPLINRNDSEGGVATGAGLTKSGVGTMILSGSSTYTGNTTVNAGNLRVTGALGNTAVTVNTGATISGSGTIGGTVHVTSGGHFARSIAATPGAQVPLTITGTLTIDSGNIIDLTAAAAPASGVYLLATATGGITYTAGTVNLTGVSGTVSVSGNDLILTTGAGNYDSWANANGIPGALSSVDSDKDGLSNLVEYGLGLNPTTSSQPPGSYNGTTRVLSFNKGADAITNGDVMWIIEESTNLGTWAPMVTQNAGDATPTISYTLPAGQPKEFARLKVVKVP